MRILEELARKHPSIPVDRELLLAGEERFAGRATAYHVRETDFLGLGCEK